MTRALLAFAALAPWLSLLPLHGAAAVLAQALTFAAAAHGAGRVVGGLAGRHEVHPLVAVQWGLAALIALSGLAIAAHVATLPVQVTIVCGCAGVHTAIVIARWHDADELALRAWLLPAGLLVALAVIHVLGAAGDVGARPFDDDGNVLAQLQRLRDTGALADAIGYARRSQLGGQLALSALATIPGDVHLVRMLEAIAFVASLGLACARIRPRDPATCTWAILVVITASALAFAPQDLAPCWTAVGLVIALHAMISDEARPSLGIVSLLAGALIAVRLELAPLAFAALVRAWWPERRDPRSAWRAALGLAVAVVPYLVARAGAAPSPAVRELLAPGHGFSAGRLALFAAIGGAGGAVVAFAVRAPSRRWLAVGALLVVAATTSGLIGERAYATRMLWPLALAAGLIAAIELSRALTLTTGAMIAAVIAIVLISEGREATGRARWTRRYLDFAANIEYLRAAGDRAPIAGGYDRMLAQAPRGARIALWVERPERLDYRAHRFIDLRTPRAAKLRVHRWDAHASRIAELLAASGADYLLIEDDDRRLERIHASWLERFVCTAWQPACADDLEAVALAHPIVAAEAGVRLVDLRSSGAAAAVPSGR